MRLIPLPTSFPVGPVNVYLAEGDPLTLIDTGPKYAPAREALQAGLHALGYRVEDLRQIILTHHHVDHVGLAVELAARSGARVFTHPYNRPWLADFRAHRAAHRGFFEELWTQAGVPTEILERMERSSADLSRWADPIIVTEALNEGDRLQLEGQEWQVFHTPGHAGGLVCLWQADRRQLLANDHFIRDISSNPVLEPPAAPGQPRPRRLVEYLRHMQRMADLQPLQALSGHGPVIDDIQSLVRIRRAFHLRRADKIAQALVDRPLTLWEICLPIFPRLKHDMDFFLALSELLGHLDLLEDSGRVQPQADGALVRWKLLPAA